MSEAKEMQAGPQPDLLIPLSKVREIAARVMKESNDLTADSADYRIGVWSGAEKVGHEIDCWATVHRNELTAAETASAALREVVSELAECAPVMRVDEYEQRGEERIPCFLSVETAKKLRAFAQKGD